MHLGRSCPVAALLAIVAMDELSREDDDGGCVAGQRQAAPDLTRSSTDGSPNRVESLPAPNRLGFDLERAMQTRYRIHTFQPTDVATAQLHGQGMRASFCSTELRVLIPGLFSSNASPVTKKTGITSRCEMDSCSGLLQEFATFRRWMPRFASAKR